TYSLIHDDLPALDNDDFRRGQLSNHKKFGEAMAILAGDSLLNLAYETVLNSPTFSTKHAKSLKLLAEYAGVCGMIKGQVCDIFGGEDLNNIDGISQIVLNKTAKLLTAPLLIASIFNDNAYFDELKSLGFKLGTLFQITDDILDATGSLSTIGKTPKKDGDKLNFVNFLGLEKAKALNAEIFTECLNIIKTIPNNDNLIELVKKVYNRKN
ncbi:MAG: polyprenyl synthetase family protein, partial [Clostridia bacterium]|nr:polyprenyl synthetase family protein [Clostridia bacterium]